MKGENKLKILELIEGSVDIVSDLIFALTTPHGHSVNRRLYELQQRQRQRKLSRHERNERQRFYDALYHLRKDGLVEDINRNNKRPLKMTAAGKKELEKLHKRKSTALPDTDYNARNDAILKIIIFDIPESERRKRDWLRGALKDMGFTMLQKSVWTGKTKIPTDFLDDIKDLKIFVYIDIFAVSKAGSLRRVI